MKKNLLALVHGGYASHTVRVLEFAKKLRETGEYDILFSGTGEYMEKLIIPAGFEYVETETLPKSHIGNILENKFVPQMFDKKSAEKYFKIESDLLKKYKPDMIMRDLFREPAGIAAKLQGIYDIFVNLASCTPHYHFDFKPINVPVEVTKYLPQGLKSNVRRMIENHARNKALIYIKKQAKKQGLKLNKNIPEGFEADLILMTDEQKLFPFNDLPENYKFVGPPLYFSNFKNPSWLESFKNDSRKKVLVTGGTTGVHEKTEFFIETFKDSNFAVAIYNNELNSLPSGFYGGETFNISTVLPFVDVFVTHGGLGAGYISLKSGVPLLALPNQFEQHINSVQFEKIGVGKLLLPKDISKKNIQKNINEIIDNPSFKKNACEFSREMKSKKPADLALKYISKGYEKFKSTKSN